MKRNLFLQKAMMIFLSFLIIFSNFAGIQPAVVQAEDNVDREDTAPLFANRVENPELKYDGWKLGSDVTKYLIGRLRLPMM